MIAAYAVAITHDISRLKSPILTYLLIKPAVINVTCARITVKVISTTSLFLICLIILENNIHSHIPRVIPPSTITKNVTSPIQTVCLVKTPERSISRTMKNIATAVPSLKRLSPSNNNVSLLEIPKSLNMANTATGSVEAMIIPNKNMIDIGIENPIHHNIHQDKYAIIAAAISNPKIAIVHIVI